MPAPSPSTSLALSRVTRQLEKVTDELIRALFTQARDPSPARAERIMALERERDELHERLAQLESWAEKLVPEPSKEERAA